MDNEKDTQIEVSHRCLVSITGTIFRVFEYSRFLKEDGLSPKKKSRGSVRQRSHAREWFAVSDNGVYLLNKKRNALMSKSELNSLLNNGGYSLSDSGFWGGYLWPVKIRKSVLERSNMCGGFGDQKERTG